MSDKWKPERKQWRGELVKNIKMLFKIIKNLVDIVCVDKQFKFVSDQVEK